jgi:hypothetical protein
MLRHHWNPVPGLDLAWSDVAFEPILPDLGRLLGLSRGLGDSFSHGFRPSRVPPPERGVLAEMLEHDLYETVRESFRSELSRRVKSSLRRTQGQAQGTGEFHRGGSTALRSHHRRDWEPVRQDMDPDQYQRQEQVDTAEQAADAEPMQGLATPKTTQPPDSLLAVQDATLPTEATWVPASEASEISEGFRFPLSLSQINKLCKKGELRCRSVARNRREIELGSLVRFLRDRRRQKRDLPNEAEDRRRVDEARAQRASQRGSEE